jgi:hypothetical protein
MNVAVFPKTEVIYFYIVFFYYSFPTEILIVFMVVNK